MSLDNIHILCETRLDYKYKMIFKDIPNINCHEGDYIKLISLMFKLDKSIYHIRYIKYRGIFLTLVRLLTLIMFCRLTKTKILWSCHNLIEHNFPYVWVNKLVVFILSHGAHKIVVFDSFIKTKLPSVGNSKTHVACFGSLYEMLSEWDECNSDFKSKFELWDKETKLELKSPYIISISTAKRNNLDLLIRSTNYFHLKGVTFDTRSTDNLFIYNEKFVKKEVFDLLRSQGMLVGYVGHNNISVPTSIYMFASFGIPILGVNIEPLASIILDNEIGLVVNDEEDLHKKYYIIKKNYDKYSNNCSDFINENTWCKSGLIHKKIVEEIFEVN
jgi:glycosyltransferase involved in cell wall biosynthesis